MRFLLDMGIARSSAAFLRRKGHDVVHLLDEGLERMHDDRIVAKAVSEGRIIIAQQTATVAAPRFPELRPLRSVRGAGDGDHRGPGSFEVEGVEVVRAKHR